MRLTKTNMDKWLACERKKTTKDRAEALCNFAVNIRAKMLEDVYMTPRNATTSELYYRMYYLIKDIKDTFNFVKNEEFIADTDGIYDAVTIASSWAGYSEAEKKIERTNYLTILDNLIAAFEAHMLPEVKDAAYDSPEFIGPISHIQTAESFLRKKIQQEVLLFHDDEATQEERSAFMDKLSVLKEAVRQLGKIATDLKEIN
ncbi:MAG: hypothetical protein NC218_01675 [Acetobacter sp.]|nr:hypothetical protein [Acetobacter sp.]